MVEFSPILIAVVIIVVIIIIIALILIYTSKNSTFSGSTGSVNAQDTCTSPPNIPLNVSISNPQADILLVQWSFMTSATSYVAYLGTTNNFNIDNAVQHKTSSSNAVNFANLALGQIYYAKVIAKNACGSSLYSSEVSYFLPYIFPSQFIISLDANSALTLADRHDASINPTNVVLATQFPTIQSSYCGYNTSTQAITQLSRPGYCLTRTTGPNQVVFAPCANNSTTKWVYYSAAKNICNANDPNDCLITTSTGTNFRNVGHGAPIADTISDWTIITV